MQRRQFQTYVILLALALIVAACGQVDPAFAPGAGSNASPAATPSVVATPAATGTPVAPFPTDATPAETVTTDRPVADWIDLPAGFAVRTAAQAEALAIAQARDMLAAPQPHVASTWLLTAREADRASGSVGGTDENPLALVWWVNLDDARYMIPKCPRMDQDENGTPDPCGSSPYAAVQIFAGNGSQRELIIGRNHTPTYVSGDVSISAKARLRTEGEAVAAALQYVPGADGGLPRITNVRLLSLQAWLRQRAEQGVIPGLPRGTDGPLWEVTMTNAAFTMPCPLLDTSQCVLSDFSVVFNAERGDPFGYYGPPPTPATPTP